MIEGRRYLILLVEPDAALRCSTQESLAAAGLKVLEIPNASEAMDTAKNIQFDLLIADPFQPFTLDLANSMARVNPRQKILFLADYAPEIVKTFGILPPGSEILQKPVTGKILPERVKACLSHGETWASLISAWRGTGSRQGGRDENLESSNLSEMA